MKTITLNDGDFEIACNALAEKMLMSGDFSALVGVRTGGVMVANMVYNNFKKKSKNVKYFKVGASRYGTSTKNASSIKKVFKFLPESILNALRVIEYYLVRLRMKLFKNVDRTISFDKELVDYLKKTTTGKVYVIDDAIDSGATVKSILDTCRSINSFIQYKVAVLVVTQNKPIVSPDICLYENVLLRFPWSADFKS
ncbi:MAG: phosphoribosyltransferase family protein [Gammaproteobacteria bacterium]|nr:phosphoribosyltransferase family protein [Gammaproteobacteria bacterium]MCW8922211.1 phosphoribosyltransferase family protein [Gammaproteobacteria bacterium]